MNTSRKGDVAELKAAAWLLEQGLEVFKNVSSVGPVDIITLNKDTGELTLIDVKYRKDNDCSYFRSYFKYKGEKLDITILDVSEERVWYSNDPCCRKDPCIA